MVSVAGISLLPPGRAVEVVDRFILCVLGWVSLEIITKQGRAPLLRCYIVFRWILVRISFYLFTIFHPTKEYILPLHLLAGQALEMDSCFVQCTVYWI